MPCPTYLSGCLIQTLAYLDPGTGSIIVQCLIAGVVGAGFAIKTFWINIKVFFSSLFGGKKARADQTLDQLEQTKDPRDVQE